MSAEPDPVAQRAALHRLDALERSRSVLLAQELWPNPNAQPPKPGSLAAGIAAAQALIAATFPPGTGWNNGPPPF